MDTHLSVLLNETIEGLAIKPEGIYVDGTLGRGGHSAEILKRLTTGRLIGFDQDQDAIEACTKRFEPYQDKVILRKDNFRNLTKDLKELGIEYIDGLTLDLGVSSPMFDQADRGFSYQLDGRLDMRMDQHQSLSAYEVVNTYPEGKLIEVLREYGEEPFARVIARKIVREREKQPIETTLQLVEVIKQALPAKVKKEKGHPAKKTFQALRIEVNDELNSLEQVLISSLDLIKPQGRIAIISFQSLEDRIVKKVFKQATSIDPILKHLPLKESELPQARFRLITHKPIEAGETELENNHRSHSAKLRIIERNKL